MNIWCPIDPVSVARAFADSAEQIARDVRRVMEAFELIVHCLSDTYDLVSQFVKWLEPEQDFSSTEAYVMGIDDDEVR